MERTTRKHVESAFKAFVSEMGGHVAVDYKDAGGYLLDHGYGGVVVARICNEHGGQSNPFGHRRMSSSEAYHTLWFAVEVLRHAKREVR